MPRRLLRSIIEFDTEITPENLVRNFQKLRKAVDVGQFDWGPDTDEKLYKYALGYFLQYFAMPSAQTVLDYFTSVNNVEVLDRLQYVAAEKPYSRDGFVHLLRTLQEEQASAKMTRLLTQTNEIMVKGVEDKKTGEIHKGIEEAILYFTKRSQEIRIDENNVQIHGDIRRDAERVREEYITAENDRGRVIGVLSGINEIDDSCKGAKKGELWMHAAFPGELKCLAGDAAILDHRTGRYRTLQELYASNELPIVTALEYEGKDSHQLVRAQASHLVQNGTREVYDVTLSSGRSVGATHNHKFFTPKGWVELRHLKPGAWVATPAKMSLGVGTDRQFTNSEVKVIGYLLGDGALTDTNLTLTASNPAVREDFIECLEDLGLREGPADYVTPSFKVGLPENRAPFVRVSRSSGRGNSPMVSPVWVLLDGLSLMGKGAYEKEIPVELWSLPEDQIQLLLGALWSTDGSCHTGDHPREDRESLSRRNDISYASVSQKLCRGVQTLLLRLGIQSSLSKVNTTYKGDPYVFYVVRVVTNPSKRRFVELIQVVGKEESFARLRERLPWTDDRLFPTDFIPEGMKIRWVGSNGERWRYVINTKNRSGARVDTLTLFRTAPEVARALAGDLNWEQVVQVASRGPEMTYDLAVPEHHSFVVNDIVTHNTTLALNWCYNAVTRFKKNIVYVSFEMPRDQIRRNIYTLHSSNARFANSGFPPIDYRHIRDGVLTKVEKEFYFEHVIKDFGSNPTYATFEVVTPDREWTMADVRSQIELLHKEFEVGMVVLDHGQWIEARKARKNKDYTIELNSVITDAKRLALNFDHNNGIPVLMLFQINRTGKTEADKNDGVYKMNALTYANNAEKTADVITTTYWNNDMRAAGLTKFTNLKNRDNPLFDPFTAHVNMTCRRIISEKRMTPRTFSDAGHAAYLESMAVEAV